MLCYEESAMHSVFIINSRVQYLFPGHNVYIPFHSQHSRVQCLLHLRRLHYYSLFNVLFQFQAVMFVGALAGGPIGGVVADRWGRKLSLHLSALPYIAGYLLISVGHLLPSVAAFKFFIYSGRCLTGVGVGWSGVCAPVGISLIDLYIWVLHFLDGRCFLKET